MSKKNNTKKVDIFDKKFDREWNMNLENIEVVEEVKDGLLTLSWDGYYKIDRFNVVKIGQDNYCKLNCILEVPVNELGKYSTNLKEMEYQIWNDRYFVLYEGHNINKSGIASFGADVVSREQGVRAEFAKVILKHIERSKKINKQNNLTK